MIRDEVSYSLSVRSKVVLLMWGYKGQLGGERVNTFTREAQ